MFLQISPLHRQTPLQQVSGYMSLTSTINRCISQLDPAAMRLPSRSGMCRIIFMLEEGLHLIHATIRQYEGSAVYVVWDGHLSVTGLPGY